ncbi:hypothetical protein PIB30_092618 [Stylosanthes scabra]|uniref:Uncharacterized protein n=1 Tax=Stylosanthes scabra TaxID=79078 RepID=A0ABU6RUV9_9FABA|nr:hypothetical protein [Stylosanthes scabra]
MTGKKMEQKEQLKEILPCYMLVVQLFKERVGNREEAEEEEENRGTKEAWNYNNLIIGGLNTKPEDEKNNLECQKTTPRHGKTQS